MKKGIIKIFLCLGVFFGVIYFSCTLINTPIETKKIICKQNTSQNTNISETNINNNLKSDILFDDYIANIDGDSSTSSLYMQDIITSRIGSYTYTVVLLDFNDAQCINGRLNKTLNDYIATYNEISNYFYLMSNGKMSLIFNFVTYTYNGNCKDFTDRPLNDGKCGDFDRQTYDEAFQNGTYLLQNSKSTYGKILQFATTTDITLNNTNGWPHCVSYICTDSTNDCVVFGDYVSTTTILHELAHSLKLMDLYSTHSASLKPEQDLMAVGQSGSPNTPINAYYRSELGWLSQSTNDDNIKTEIEEINSSGTYTLYYPFEQNKTVGFLFGSNYGQKFYIEARYPSYGNQGKLIVNRVNETISRTNAYASSLNECFITTIAQIESNNERITKNGNESDKNTLYYANGDRLDYSIGNVKFYSNYLTFDFCSNGYLNIPATLTVYNSSNYSPITKASIYLNNQYIGQTNSNGQFNYNAQKDDILTIKDSTGTEIIYTIPYVSFEKNNFKIPFSIANKCKFSVTVENQRPTNNHANYYYSPITTYDPQVNIYIDNNLVFSGKNKCVELNLFDNSVVTFASPLTPLTSTFTYNATNNTLVSNNGIISETNKIFNVKLFIPVTEYTFSINITGAPDKHVGIKSVKALSSITGCWAIFFPASNFTEYSPMPVYLTSEYIKVQIEYQNYYENNTIIFTLNSSQTSYTQTIEQNFIQSGFDWFSNLFK